MGEIPEKMFFGGTGVKVPPPKFFLFYDAFLMLFLPAAPLKINFEWVMGNKNP